MRISDLIKLSVFGKLPVPAFSGSANTGTLAENILINLRRAARHPMAEGAVLLAAAQYVAAIVGLATSIVSARVLGPKDFGLTAVILSYPMLIGSLVAIKTGSVTTRYISMLRERRQGEMLGSICLLGYGLDFLASILAFLLAAATASWVAENIFSLPQAAPLMIAFAASFPLWSLHGTSSAILISFQKFRWMGVLQILDQVIGAVLVIGLLLAGFGVRGVVLGTAAGHVLIAIIATVAASRVFYSERSTYWWRGSLAPARPLRQEMSGLFGWNYLVVTWAGLIGQVPLMILAHLRGPEAAGFYRLATSIVTVGSYLETSMGKVAYPVLSARWGSGSRVHLLRALRGWTIGAGLPVAAFVLFTLPFYPFLIPKIFGAQYSAMVGGVQILIVGAAASALFFWLNSFYYASGNVSIWTLGVALQSTFVIGLAWFFVRLWGFNGMAAVAAVGKVAFTLLMTVVVYKFASTPPTGEENVS